MVDNFWKKDLKLFKTIIKNSFFVSSLTGLFISIIYFINEKENNLMSDMQLMQFLLSI